MRRALLTLPDFIVPKGKQFGDQLYANIARNHDSCFWNFNGERILWRRQLLSSPKWTKTSFLQYDKNVSMQMYKKRSSQTPFENAALPSRVDSTVLCLNRFKYAILFLYCVRMIIGAWEKQKNREDSYVYAIDEITIGKIGHTWMAKCMVPSYASNIFFHIQGGLFGAI